MAFEFVEQQILCIEQSAADRTSTEIIHALRSLGLTEFSALLARLPDKRYPILSSKLPRMASEEVQKIWTGSSGLQLLGTTVSFVNCLMGNYFRLKGSPKAPRVLDFGCGYGRIIRPMYFYCDPSSIWGVDPWGRSIDTCKQDGVLGHLAISDYIPERLPVGSERFDLIYSFSVFTHLSKRTTITSLATLRKYIAKDGLLAITIRPIEYWYKIGTGTDGDRSIQRDAHPCVESHHESGFAFAPHQRSPIDGEVTYGDTSMTLEWLQNVAEGWRIVAVDRSIADSLQVYVFLAPI